MRDVGYVAAGYTLTMVTLAGYRWRLAIRMRRAKRLAAAVSLRNPDDRARQ
jgi:hypothetical protein